MQPELSMLDLLPVRADIPASRAARSGAELARLGEELGYVRYWVAEHHGIGSIASSAPEVILGQVGALTSTIRIGTGGIMLPNHRPLRVAELFHTLEALYPGRVDLGLGRAPGSDARASHALRAESPSRFGDLLNQMLGLSNGTLSRTHPAAGVRVMPEDVRLPPIWILGSSGASAAAAGTAGMGYSFATHFSADPPARAFERYRAAFKPSERFPEPHAILAVSAVCAPTDDEAQALAASVDLAALRIANDDFSPMPTPEEAQAYEYTDAERQTVAANRARHVVGEPGPVAARLKEMASETGADEIMLVSYTADEAARFASYRLLAGEMI